LVDTAFFIPRQHRISLNGGISGGRIALKLPQHFIGRGAIHAPRAFYQRIPLRP
jgi:hypothetical protein